MRTFLEGVIVVVVICTLVGALAFAVWRVAGEVQQEARLAREHALLIAELDAETRRYEATRTSEAIETFSEHLGQWWVTAVVQAARGQIALEELRYKLYAMQEQPLERLERDD